MDTCLDLVIYVIWCNEGRRQFIETQLASYNLPFSVIYFKAATPETSSDYIIKDSPVDDKLQCCFRSHINALHDFVSNKSGGLVLILEDDVCLVRDNFLSKLTAIVNQYTRNTNIDYVSIGYLPLTLKSEPLHTKIHMLQKDDTLYYDFSKANFTIWGSQAQLFSYTTARRIVDLLHRSDGSLVLTAVDEHLKTHKSYQNKEPYTMIDALLPLLFSQGIVYPPLVVENNVVSTIHHSRFFDKRMNEWRLSEKTGVFQLADYYSW